MRMPSPEHGSGRHHHRLGKDQAVGEVEIGAHASLVKDEAAIMNLALASADAVR